MKDDDTPLALRRARLIAECARQRGDMADHLNLLKAPVERIGGAAGFIGQHKTSLLAGAGVLLGVLLARPKPLLGAVAAGTSLWKIAQAALPAVQRVLPLLRARLGGQLE